MTGSKWHNNKNPKTRCFTCAKNNYDSGKKKKKTSGAEIKNSTHDIGAFMVGFSN